MATNPNTGVGEFRVPGDGAGVRLPAPERTAEPTAPATTIGGAHLSASGEPAEWAPDPELAAARAALRWFVELGEEFPVERALGEQSR